MTTPSHKQHYRLSPAAAALYVGPEGEVIVQLVDFLLRVQDGVTPGGFAAVSAQFVAATYASIASISAVGFSGQYADILGSPTISTVGHTGQWNDILGKPSFATVATTGVYNDLTGKPTLGTAAAKNITISTSGPSGGADGDVWLRY